jgi:hypothetical protein
MVRSEAKARLVEEVLPSSTSQFVPLSPRSQFIFKETDPKGAGGSNQGATPQDASSSFSAEATEIVVAATNAAKIIERMAFPPSDAALGKLGRMPQRTNEIPIGMAPNCKAGAGARSSG